jgi:hypothetical protein
MLFQKLFRLLVLGGAVLGGASAGCGGQAQSPDKKSEVSDGGQASDSSTTQTADAGADAGASSSGGGGVIGW